ncbi:MAG: AAA family ATPase [Deltaproteobacteria bacterium]
MNGTEKSQTPEEAISAEQKTSIAKLKKNLEITSEEWMELLEPYGIASAHELTSVQASQFIEKLEFRTPAGQIKRTLEFLHSKANGDCTSVFEIAIIGSKKQKSNVFEGFAGGFKPVIAGWFSDFDKAAPLVRRAQELRAAGIYTTLNTCNSALLARANNRLKAGIGRTKDTEIESINNLLIDIDPVRPEGISSNDQEHDAALELATKIQDELSEQFGFPEPLVGDSGNGAHLVYPLPSMPNTHDNVELLKTCLSVLSNQYSTLKLEVDEKVFNSSRLTKVYGTMVCKGDPTPDRPHRRARIISVPEQRKAVTLEQLRALAATELEEEGLANDAPEQVAPSSPRLDVPRYLGAYGFDIKEVKQHGSATLYSLHQCLFNANHGPKEAAIVQTETGALRYQCFHEGCKDRKWADARAKISGDAKLNPFMLGGSTNSHNSEGKDTNKDNTVDDFTAVPLEDLRPARFLESKPSEYSFELGGSLLQGTVGSVVAQGGLGKSQFLVQWALAHAGGTTFLDGRYEVSHIGKVFALLAEDSEIVVWHRVRDTLTATVNKEELRNVVPRLNENLFIQSVTGYDTRFLEVEGGNRHPSLVYSNFLARLQQIDGLSLVILDPLSRFFSAGDENDATLGTYFISLLEWICKTTGATVVTSHHVRKGSGKGRKSLTQEASRGSTALVNAVRWQLTMAYASASDFNKKQKPHDNIDTKGSIK